MNNFKLTKKQEKQKVIEQLRAATETRAKNKDLNIFGKNPQTTGAIVLGVIGFALVLLGSGFFGWAITGIFGELKLLKAKKIGENKKFINFGYAIVYIPLIFVLAGVYSFVIEALKIAQ